MAINKMLFGIAAAALVAGVAIGYQVLVPTQAAPALNVTTITGEKFTDAQWRGKVVLVNFWATSCVTCVKEMPTLVQLHNKYQAKGFDTLAVAMAYDRPDYVLHFAKTRALPFKVVLDLQGELARNFDKVAVTPTSFLLDKRGHILKRWVGEPDVAALSGLIEKAL
jgi:peroxiredoxin